MRRGVRMVALPVGEFLMGDEEGPQHRVTIGRRCAIGRYPVTFDEYDHFCAAARREPAMPNSARGSACGRALGWWHPGAPRDLCAEVCPQPPRRSIATAIGCLAFLRRTPTGREISEVLFVDGWDGGYVVREIAGG